MANNQQNIGKDATLSLVGPAGPQEQLGLLAEFTSKPKTTMVNTLPINNSGLPVNRNTFQGWEGSFKFDRQNGAADRLQNLLEANFVAGNADVQFSISEQIRNPDGSVDRHVYRDVHISMDDAGSKQQNTKITQTFNWVASQRVNG